MNKNQLNDNKKGRGNRISSKEGIRDHAANGNLQKGKDRVLAYLSINEPMSRKMLEKPLNMACNYITRYVNELIRDGKIKELEARKRCKVSNRLVGFVSSINYVEDEK